MQAAYTTQHQKRKQPTQKVGKRPEKTFLQRNIQMANKYMHEKMLNMTHYQRNANQNHNKITPHTCQNGYYEKDNKEQAVQKMYRKRTPRVLLVGM